MSKIVWLGASTTLATGYGGVTAVQSFAFLTSVHWGYATADIINAGVGSSDTADMISRLPTDVIAHNPAVCAVNAGGIADIVNAVSISTYKSRLSTLFSMLMGNSIKPVAVNDVCKRWSTLAEHATMRSYTEAYEEVAASLNIPVVDLWREYYASLTIDGFPAWNANYVDDVHQTVAGNTFAASIMTRPRYSNVF